MNSTQVVVNSTHYLELLVTDLNGDSVSGLTVNYVIKKSSDNSTFAFGTMTDLGTGVYKTSTSFTTAGLQYRVIYTTPSGYSNEIESLLIIEEPDNTLIRRVLALVFENYKLFNPVYITVNGQPELSTGKIKTYPSASDLDADTNELAEYNINATYNANGTLNTYTVKKV